MYTGNMMMRAKCSHRSSVSRGEMLAPASVSPTDTFIFQKNMKRHIRKWYRNLPHDEVLRVKTTLWSVYIAIPLIAFCWSGVATANERTNISLIQAYASTNTQDVATKWIVNANNRTCRFRRVATSTPCYEL